MVLENITARQYMTDLATAINERDKELDTRIGPISNLYVSPFARVCERQSNRTVYLSNLTSLKYVDKVRIEDLGEEPVQVDGRELVLRHIAIVAETGQSHHVWLDGDRVIRVLVPHDEFEAIRLFTADQSSTDPRGTR